MEVTPNLAFTESNFKALLKVVIRLQDELSELKSENKRLQSELSELKRQQKKDSHNSSKPPSSDGLQKKRSVNLREVSGKRPGGQQGHAGRTLEFSDSADKILYYLPESPCACGWETEVIDSKVYHEIDLPSIKPVVTEHRVLTYRCTCCGTTYQDANFQGHKVQYGPGIKGLAIYLKDYQLIPYKRLSELFKDCFSCLITPGSLANFTNRAQETLLDFKDFVKANLQSGAVIHGDETGMRVSGQTHWMHVASNKGFTAYHLDAQRGKDAIDRAGILPDYKGTVVHDRFASYFRYPVSHGLCNAHILRELIYLKEQVTSPWPQQLIDLLLKAKLKTDSGESVNKAYITRIKNQYKAIVRQELRVCGKAMKNGSQTRGKPKRSESHNLLLALNKYHQEVLAFLTDPAVPFDNNLAERDLRMVKTKQKVSGSFRSPAGGQAFASIRSYISTLKKQKINVLDGFYCLFRSPQFFLDQFSIAE